MKLIGKAIDEACPETAPSRLPDHRSPTLGPCQLEPLRFVIDYRGDVDVFPDDLLGLAEEGRYTNSAKAITPLAMYRFPVSALRSQLARDADLEFRVICKLIHELRETQRHAFLLARRRALSRVVIFLQLLENLQVARGERTAEIYLPMNRTDIGQYLGISLEAVSRAFRGLTARGIIKSRGRQHLKIADRSTFNKIAADTTNAP
ncbi:MAG: Crp/Fnr family transcriptional regulator [Bradyrhizobium sp.]|uniref:Crp/Fnr family transcriptional regulator n=1 Tax=Bradyrhizobium sp. TaxID=376 RepID=UPI002731E9BD|nr:Crp/Fnr family transcriptional regulator [Bradyrhizobium sp.]MDP1868866.1 Crp/Fnr family transcriptional regulator [Bradyrhizobium sp.]